MYQQYTSADGLPSNNVYRVLESSDGSIYVLTEGGICKYIDDDWHCYQAGEGYPNNDIYNAVEDHNHRLWLYNDKNTLSYLRGDSIVTFESSQTSRKNPLYYTQGYAVHTDRKHTYRISADDSIYVDLASDLDKLKMLLDSKSTVCPVYSNFYIDANNLCRGTKVIGRFSLCSSLAQVDVQTGSLENLSLSSTIATSSRQPIIQHHKDGFQIFYNDSLSIFSSSGHLLKRVVMPTELIGSINSAMIDSRGNQWVCTPKGLYQLPYYCDQGRLDILSWSKDLNIAKLRTNDNLVYAAGRNGDIFVVDKDNLGSINCDINKLRGTYLYDITIWKDEVLTSNRSIGISSFKTDTKQSTCQYPRKLLESISSSKECFASEDLLFVRTTDKVLIINLKNQRREAEILKATSAIALDTMNNRLWFSADDTLYHQNLQHHNDTTSIPITYLPETDYLHYLGDNYLFAYSSSAGSILYSESKVIPLSLSDRVVEVSQENDDLYILTSHGLYGMRDWKSSNKQHHVDTLLLAFETIGSGQFNDFLLLDSLALIATDFGIYTLSRSTLLPEYVLPITCRYKDSQIPNRTNITLPYNNNGISLEVHSENYIKPIPVTYLYKIDELDKVVNKTTDNVIKYTKLPAGNYTLSTWSTDALGNESSKITTFIEVPTPLWKQPAIYLLVLILSGILLWMLTRLLVKREKKRLRVRQDYAELELNALQSQMNPHFVFNCMNSIQCLVNESRIKEADHYITVFSGLMREYLDYSRSKFVTIKQELDTISKYLEMEQIRFEEKLSYTVSNQLSSTDHGILIPSTILQPFVENALIHGIYPLSRRGHVSVIAEKIQNMVTISVVDDGVGLHAKSSADHLKTSTAIESCRQKLDIINQIDRFKVDFEVFDNLESGTHASGTTSLIRIQV